MNKKTAIPIIISFFFVLAISTLFYNSFFLKPLKKNGELFPQNNAIDSQIPQNKKVKISDEIVEKYGITVDEIAKIDKNKLFFIDGREPEEFANNHVSGAKHIRTLDIADKEIIKSAFAIDEDIFSNATFIIYCHDGTRSAEQTSELDLANVKFLVKGVSVFYDGSAETIGIGLVPTGIATIEKEIQDYDFTISSDEASKMLDGKNLFIDGRLEVKDVFSFAKDFRIGKLASDQYVQALEKILLYKNGDIIYIADTYGDMFYAKLLIQRLSKQYDFDLKKFHILFAQSDNFYVYLKDKKIITE
jgi:rhodanese-related sulfurtransferase